MPRFRRSENLPTPFAWVVTTTFVLMLATACSGPDGSKDSLETAVGEPAGETQEMTDTHSYARPDEIAVEHLDLDIVVDFEAKQISGQASLRVKRHGDASTLHLDTRDLEIRKVTLADGSEAAFELGTAQGVVGQELSIEMGDSGDTVTIDYATSPGAAAVQWLEPAMTSSGKPFLFTQSQAILARTWVPIQDSPAVRLTYDAKVQVPSDLLAVMSAENPTAKTADGVYSFSMPQAIPSYLLALAVGDIEFRALGEHTGVYAEPAIIDKAAYEFAETEDMLVAVEGLYGPYRWGRYDILVLPPAFPFGGMENPRLTFATPTILAGDRSLVALIAHELAHSWSGNLVTNATWNDFWLNEGFTVYLERRIMEAVNGEDYVDMLALLGLQDLRATVEDLGSASADTHLYLDLAGRDPDDGMTDIAYEKGYSFLRSMEETVGRERFDAFLRTWFDEHAFGSYTTSEFVAYLDEHLVAGDAALRDELQVDAWIYGPGLPNNLPEVASSRFAAVDAQRQAWLDGERQAAALDTGEWSSHEWLHFLRGLPDDLSIERMAELDKAFGLSATGNSEVLHAWLHHVIESRFEPGYDSLRDFLTRQGRRKFLKPLYERMAGHEDLKPMAADIYKTARAGYHSVSSNTIDAILDEN